MRSIVLRVVILGMLIIASLQNIYSQRNAHNLPSYDKKLIHFGFALGMNYATFTIKPESQLNPFDSLMSVTPSGMVGFDIGIVANLHLGNYFDLRFVPALSLLDRSVNYELQYGGKTTKETQGIESVNLNFPLLLKFKSSRMSNVRFYVVGGAQYSIDLATRSKKRTDGDQIKMKLTAGDLQAQVGVGIDFYLEFFKFAIEAKMSYGMLDMLKHENTMHANSIKYLRSKTFHISFLFEG